MFYRDLFGSSLFGLGPIVGSLVVVKEEKTSNDDKTLTLEGKPVKVYINNRTTIMEVGSQKFVATAEKGELFDIEKGILVCLAKYFGVKSSSLLKLVESAQIQKPKEKKPVKKNTSKKR